VADVRTRSTGRLILGLIIVTLGLLWTLDNLDVVDSDAILRWWPVAILAVGLYRVVGVGGQARLGSGLFLSLLGFLLLLDTTNMFDFAIWDFWPLFLIGLGGWLVLSANRTRTLRAESGDLGSRLDVLALMSGVERNVQSQTFEGGEATAIMGGAEIDLRHAVARADTIAIEVCAIMGGIDIRVPEDWQVVNEATAIMGALEDKSKPAGPGGRTTLVLKGIVVMGGVEIKN
jgi:hypothetical protein